MSSLKNVVAKRGKRHGFDKPQPRSNYRRRASSLLDLNITRNPEFSYDVYDRFDLDEIDQAECKWEFRIEKRDIPFLADVLDLPATFRCPQRTVADGIEGLLKRMSKR